VEAFKHSTTNAINVSDIIEEKMHTLTLGWVIKTCLNVKNNLKNQILLPTETKVQDYSTVNPVKGTHVFIQVHPAQCNGLDY
jgi:hypothetical protein